MQKPTMMHVFAAPFRPGSTGFARIAGSDRRAGASPEAAPLEPAAKELLHGLAWSVSATRLA